jgi:hypothetical protein
MKKCCKCKELKPLLSYYKHKGTFDGLFSQCIECVRLSNANRYENNPLIKEKNRLKMQERRILSKKQKEYDKLYAFKNKERISKYVKEYNEKNIEIRLAKRLLDKIKKDEVLIEKGKKYILIYRDEIKKQESVKKLSNLEKRRIYEKIRKAHDPLFLLSTKLRSKISIIFKSKKICKSEATKELLGCDFIFAKQHIESNFKKGMHWDNYGDWHIDHKYPLSKAKTEKEIIELFNYKNLQPLWAKENMIKKSKI